MTVMKRLLVTACFLTLPSLALADDQGSAALDDKGKEFITEAAQGGMAEVKLGELAQKNAKDPAVKKFGKLMVDDHSKSNQKLKSIASKKGVTLPTTLSDEMQKKYDELAQKTGAEFDKAYIELMEEDHKEDIDKFKDYVDDGKDPELKRFAQECLPVLRTHRMVARTTEAHEKHTR